MNINWQSAQDKVNLAIDNLGTDIQWLQRVISGSSSFDTGSTVTYGYGDEIQYFITGSTKAIIYHVSAVDVVTDAGFFVEDYEKFQVRSDSQIEFWDRLEYPSGSGVLYIVLPLHVWRGGNIIIAKDFLGRRLVPRSGSQF